jgi:hypothetical protein
LRAEVCSLRSALSRRAEGAVFSELAAIRGHMAQLLKRCPKEDGFRPATTSRACTPVHESLASPPLQSFTSLCTQPGAGDVHRASGPVAAGCSQENGNHSFAQPTSEASAFSSQAAHLLASSDGTAHAAPLPDSHPSPCSTQERVVHNIIEPPSPILRAAVAPSAAQPRLAPRNVSVPGSTTPPATLPGNTQAGVQLGQRSHFLTLASAPQASSIKHPVPRPAVPPGKHSTHDNSASPRNGERGEVPTPFPGAYKSTVKKKRKCSSKV